MTISNTTHSGEIERSVPPNAKQCGPEKRRPKEKYNAEPAATVETTNTEPLRKALAQSNISLNFRRDDRTGRVVVEMIDDSTGDPIRQIPSEVSLRLSEMFSKVQGHLFEARF